MSKLCSNKANSFFFFAEKEGNNNRIELYETTARLNFEDYEKEKKKKLVTKVQNLVKDLVVFERPNENSGKKKNPITLLTNVLKGECSNQFFRNFMLIKIYFYFSVLYLIKE